VRAKLMLMADEKDHCSPIHRRPAGTRQSGDVAGGAPLTLTSAKLELVAGVDTAVVVVDILVVVVVDVRADVGVAAAADVTAMKNSEIRQDRATQARGAAQEPVQAGWIHQTPESRMA
jgi:hypothetical protein